MNSNSAVATTASAISGAMIGGVMVWLCTTLGLAAPPADVAGTLGALLLGGGHAAVNWINDRFPAKSPTLTSIPVEIKAAPVVASPAIVVTP